MDKFIVGLFDDEEVLVKAIKQTRQKGLKIYDVLTPFPIHGIEPLLGYKDSRLHSVGFWVGLCGCLFAFSFMTWVFTSSYPINYGGKQANNFGFIDDTLYAVIHYPPITANGQPMSYLNYFDGDYLHGPNAICSTPGLGEKEQIVVQEDIQVFPNPASDFLTISLSQEIENANYELLSLDGKLIQNGALVKGENTLKISQSLEGVYLLKIETQNSVVVKKVFF